MGVPVWLWPFECTFSNICFCGALLYFILVMLVVVGRKLFHRRFQLSGKNVLITGGSSGLGLAIAQRCVERGAHVTILARNREKLEKAKQILNKHCKSDDQRVLAISCDVTDFKSCTDAVATVQSEFERPHCIDMVVANAGTAAPGYFLEQDVALIRKQMELNYFGAIHIIKAALPSMAEARSGHIVLVSSAMAFLGFVGYAQYAPSKWALRSLCDCLRNELRLYNIKVTGFYPSNMDTPGFVEEEKVKPPETKEIEGTGGLFSPLDSADHLLKGLDSGTYCITQEPIIWLLRLASQGVGPRVNPPLEILLAPLAVLVGVVFTLVMDSTVKPRSFSAEKRMSGAAVGRD
eukprot:117280_1